MPARTACPAPRVRVGGCKARVSESASGCHVNVPHAHFLMLKIGRWKGTVGVRRLSSSVTCETSQERLSDIFSECDSSLGRPSLTMETPASINLLEQSLKRQQEVCGCENSQATACLTPNRITGSLTWMRRPRSSPAMVMVPKDHQSLSQVWSVHWSLLVGFEIESSVSQGDLKLAGKYRVAMNSRSSCLCLPSAQARTWDTLGKRLTN